MYVCVPAVYSEPYVTVNVPYCTYIVTLNYGSVIFGFTLTRTVL